MDISVEIVDELIVSVNFDSLKVDVDFDGDLDVDVSSGGMALLQDKSIELGSTEISTTLPDAPYDGLRQVEYEIDDEVVKANNIVQGVSILGVAGSVKRFEFSFVGSDTLKVVGAEFVNNDTIKF